MYLKFQTFAWSINDLKSKIIDEETIETSERDAVLEEFINELFNTGMKLAGPMTSQVVDNHLVDTLCYTVMSEAEHQAVKKAKAAEAGIILPE